MDSKKKKGFLFNNVNLFVAYLLILIVGILIIYGMTTFLNNKVKEFTDVSIEGA